MMACTAVAQSEVMYWNWNSKCQLQQRGTFLEADDPAGPKAKRAWCGMLKVYVELYIQVCGE